MKGRRKSRLSGWWNAPPVWMSLLFVIDLCVGSSKTAPGLAADGILQMVWNKRLFLGPFVPVCFDPCCRGEQRNVGCRWAALQSPVCVTSTEHLQLSFTRLGSKSGSSSWDCTEVSSKTPGILAEERALGMEDTHQSFSGAVFHSSAFTVNQGTEVIFSTSPHHPSFCL